jgi:hypothetical protein
MVTFFPITYSLYCLQNSNLYKNSQNAFLFIQLLRLDRKFNREYCYKNSNLYDKSKLKATWGRKATDPKHGTAGFPKRGRTWFVYYALLVFIREGFFYLLQQHKTVSPIWNIYCMH